ncbi:MAG: gliding motility protein GldL [Bacteroidales bacterium]|nr:gliding motility protein GldL [Bacteroidales bacterium]
MAKKELSKFQKFLSSRKYKTFMAYLYGWGASVVMIGAYFKLTHIPGADFMLALGLGIEALIFFMSAFEPVHMEYEWDNVFVELEEDWDGVQKTQFATTGTAAKSTGAPVDVEEAMLSKMFEKMNVSEDTFKKLGRGIDQLAENAGQMANISNAMAATTNYATAMDRATKSISDFSNAYIQTNQKLSDSLGKLDFSALDANTIKKVASSMTSLNSIYELQLQGAEQTSAASKKLTETMNKYMDNLNASSQNAGQLNQQLTQLSQRLTALNNVYGGMLSAMNIKA